MECPETRREEPEFSDRPLADRKNVVRSKVCYILERLVDCITDDLGICNELEKEIFGRRLDDG